MILWLKKWTVWEYLPWWLANVPVYTFYSWFALRARHLFFFSNVNPAIPLGGAVGESKHGILKLVPDVVKPKTVLVLPDMTFENVRAAMQAIGLDFPVVAKPDVGERGFLVQKFTAEGPLRQHLERYPVPFLIQEFLTHPLELSVLFHRFPDNGRFGVSSICIKEFLSVTGDGRSSIRQLMAVRPRAAFQLERFEQENPGLLDRIPESGEAVLLEPIGNHIRGTKFLNGNHLIDPALEAVFEQVCRQMDGVLYGRFDLKCASLEDLLKGSFQVMELNGILAEPAHVYDPQYGVLRAYRDFYRHWQILFDLHKAQRNRGIRPTSHRAAWQFVQGYFRYKKDLESR